jgi:predicted Zn-dependent protease
MNTERLRMLEQYAKEDPDDPFPSYAMALEWVTNDPAKAMELFDQLLSVHPDYLPVYYHAGHLLFQSGDSVKAKIIIETGIRKTKAAGDLKALAELKTLYDEID